MDEFEIIKHIMMKENISYDELSARLGYKSKSSSYMTLNRKHMYVDTWRKFLGELGYDIVIQNRNDKSESYVISDDNLPSPLRFHDMNLDLDKILGDKEV